MSSNKTWVSAMPSNIALIKYMGKTDVKNNKPTNNSLSYTLNHLKSYVTLTLLEVGDINDSWSALESFDSKKFETIELSKKAQDRFLKHFEFLKTQWGLEEYYFKVQSNNLFPQGCGLASSASSFAALTMATYKAAQELEKLDLSIYELATMSQKGSGSSCRSFFENWSLWDDEGAKEVLIEPKSLLHQVVIVVSREKKISSSQAHKNVTTSSLFKGRPERANLRCDELINSFRSKDWNKAFEITWAEFWDMHALFETSTPHFNYMTSHSLEVLREVENVWSELGTGPLVTMDAGANVHLLYQEGDIEIYKTLNEKFNDKFKVIGSHE